MASKLRVVVALLLATACLLVVLAATVADASRPLKGEPSSPTSASEGDDDAGLPAAVVVESPPAGDIQTVVGAAEHGGGCGGNKFVMSIDMLGGIKDSGPSPGAGH